MRDNALNEDEVKPGQVVQVCFGGTNGIKIWDYEATVQDSGLLKPTGTDYGRNDYLGTSDYDWLEHPRIKTQS